MNKGSPAILGLVLILLALPAAALAAYTYQGSALQPLAFIDPVVPGQAFKVWNPEGVGSGLWSVGTSADFLRNSDNSNDIDVIFSLTGAYGLTENLTVGAVFPYIIRDPDFNESDLLDLRAFARYRFFGDVPGTSLGAELLASLPTAAQGGSFPFTLDTTLVKFSLALSGRASGWDYSLNAGYQSYQESESGDDSDLFYGFYAGRDLTSSLTGVLEYSASKHTHSGDPLDEEITDATALAGLKFRLTDNTTLGLSVGSGLSDSSADMRSLVSLLWRPRGTWKSMAEGAAGKAGMESFAPAPPVVPGQDLLANIKPGKGDILVQVSNHSGVRGLGERIARHLEKAGYVVPVVEEGSGKRWKASYIYYGKNTLEPATDIKLLFGRPDTLKRVSYGLKGIGVLVVLGEDMADWNR